jgi:hypothetical protein
MKVAGSGKLQELLGISSEASVISPIAAKELRIESANQNGNRQSS